MEDDEQHLAWTLLCVPGIGNSGAGVAPAWHGLISKHQRECGVVYAQWLRKFANEDGYIHVDDLPMPKKKFQRPMRGQQSVFNNAGKWVPLDTEEPPVPSIPDVRKYTVQERAALIAQLMENGDIKEDHEFTNYAAVVDSSD